MTDQPAPPLAPDDAHGEPVMRRSSRHTLDDYMRERYGPDHPRSLQQALREVAASRPTGAGRESVGAPRPVPTLTVVGGRGT